MTVVNASSSCFVAMPFREYFLEYYERIYKPAIEASGMTCVRGDSMFRAGDVITQLLTALLDAEVVVADISEVNANVYYEIGVAHSRLKPTVLLAQRAEVIPFDLRTDRCLIYDTQRADWATDLRERLTRAINETLASPSSSLPSAVQALRYAGRLGSEDSVSSDLGDRDVLDQRLTSIERGLSRLAPLLDPSGASALTNEVDATALRQTAEAMLQAGSSARETVDQLIRQGAPKIWADFTVTEIRRTNIGQTDG